MNKKLLLAGIAVTAGFVFLTAFGPKQDQQKQEIAAAVTARLDEFRAQKEEECTMKVNAEAQTRYQAYLASKPVETPKAAAGKTTKKKGSSTKVTPLPQKAPTDPQKTRPGATQPGNVEEQKTRSGASPTTTPVSPAEQKKRPGAAGGGGN